MAGTFSLSEPTIDPPPFVHPMATQEAEDFVLCCVVLCCVVLCCVVLCCVVLGCPTQPTQPNPTQPNPTQPNPTQPNPTQPNPTQQHNTTQHNTTQHNKIKKKNTAQNDTRKKPKQNKDTRGTPPISYLTGIRATPTTTSAGKQAPAPQPLSIEHASKRQGLCCTRPRIIHKRLHWAVRHDQKPRRSTVMY